MAQIYTGGPSVEAGSPLALHVSSATSTFRVDFYRQGATLVKVGSAAFTGGHVVGQGEHHTDWAWPGWIFVVPATWRSGAYVALVVEDGAPAAAADVASPANRGATCVFAVRSATPGASACIFYKLPTFTWVAYNDQGDPPASFYTNNGKQGTMRRPGHGSGPPPWDVVVPDAYDGTSPRQTFWHWDAPFIAWLEANGYDVDYGTDLDVHHDTGSLLAHYRLVLSVGHDEYWSAELRDHLEAFVAHGGNVAYFSGNVCWWRVHVVENGTALQCDKAVAQWWNGASARPENSITGVSYRNAGGHWDGRRQAVGYTVQHASHWLYAGVTRPGGGAIADGDVIGGEEDVALVGYEADGAELEPALPGQPRVAAHTDGTPASFVVLGVGPVPYFQDRPVGGAAATATMGVYTRGGIVFTAATTDWARVLASGHAQVEQLTRNVLDRLRSRAVPILGLGTACGRNAAVEGATLRLRVDTAKLLHQTNLTYEWQTSAGAAGAANLPTFDVTLPSPPALVTVWVTVRDGTDCPAFGTLSFVPMTLDEYAMAQLVCKLRELPTYRSPVIGSREGTKLFVDPLWDPIRGYRGPHLDRASLVALRDAGRALTSLAVRLLRDDTGGEQGD
jgi:hypothetical protein